MHSVHRAPSPALREIVARHYVFNVDLPDGFELRDNLLSETAFIRILLRGDWAAASQDGEWYNVGPVVFFGPNSRPLPVRCLGGFKVVGVAIRPAGWHLLFDQPAHRFTDSMIALGELWGEDAERLHRNVIAAGDDVANVIAAVEKVLQDRIAPKAGMTPDPEMLAFERIARFDSTMKIADVCKQLGLAQHVLERRCRASFGMTPKRVLRRSRFLDMASVMRGLWDAGEEALAELRYADQSHLNREFREFIGMTPGQFAQTPTPLLTAGLELRNSRRESDPQSDLWISAA